MTPGEISEPADHIEQPLELRIHQDRPFAAFIDRQRKPGNVRLFPGALDGDFNDYLPHSRWFVIDGRTGDVSVFRKEHGKTPGRDRHEASIAQVQSAIRLFVVRLVHRQRQNIGNAHFFDPCSNELHIDVFAMRFPQTLRAKASAHIRAIW